MPDAGTEMSGASPLRGRRWCLTIAIVSFFFSRFLYYRMGVRFDAEPLQFYWQVIDPALLRHALWQSLLYLRTQPPGLNLYIGIVLHLFPRHYLAVFEASGLALGLVLTVCLFLLLERLRVSRTLALLITVVCVISPVTVLYENWLFYEYPIAVLFCVAALFLHRYADSHRRIDAIVFFAALSVLGLLRIFYNLIWFCALAALIAYALPGFRRRTVLCAAGPGAVLLAAGLKSLIMVGLFFPGSDILGAINLAAMATGWLPRDIVVGMASAGKISPVLPYYMNGLNVGILDFVPVPPKTGISLLDTGVKSTGWINMESLRIAALGKPLRQDGLTVMRAHPEAVLTSIHANLGRYFLPADIGWPFDGRQPPPNQVLSGPLKLYDLIVAGRLPGGGHAWTLRFAIPLLLLFGLARSWRCLMRVIRGLKSNAADLTVSFAFGNIAYLTGVVILFSPADQNRYAFEIFPLYTSLLGSLIVYLVYRFTKTDTD